MGISKVTRNYQVTIPKDVRKMQDIKIGDEVVFNIEGNKVQFVKLDIKTIIKEVSGLWKESKNVDSLDYVKSIRKEWSKRSKRLGL